MNVFAFILFIIAAVLFLVGDAPFSRYNRSHVALGLFVLTVGFIVQFCAQAHQITF